MSSSFTTRYSVPSSFTSVPLYLPNRTLSPTLTFGARTLPLSSGLAVADGDDFALDRLLGGRVRDHDAAGGHLFFFHALDDHAVVQRLDIHWQPSRKWLNELGKVARILAVDRGECQDSRAKKTRRAGTAQQMGPGVGRFQGRGARRRPRRPKEKVRTRWIRRSSGLRRERARPGVRALSGPEMACPRLGAIPRHVS